MYLWGESLWNLQVVCLGCAGFGFISGEICQVCLQSRSLNCNCYCWLAASSSPCFFFLFLAISIYRSFLVWVGLNQSRTIVWVPERLKKLVAHPTLPCLAGELFLARSSLLVLNSSGLGDGMVQAKWSCLPFLLVRLFSGFLFHSVTKIS